MAAPDPAILDFLRSHHVLSLATSVGEGPYCASCFYVLDDGGDTDGPRFIFVSDPATRHGWEMLTEPRVAANIFTETRDPARIQGVQITGTARELAPEDERARELYFQAFPEARAIAARARPVFWALRPDFLKMTDNTVAFGFKRIWEADR